MSAIIRLKKMLIQLHLHPRKMPYLPVPQPKITDRLQHEINRYEKQYHRLRYRLHRIKSDPDPQAQAFGFRE